MLTYLLTITCVGRLCLKADRFRNAIQLPIEDNGAVSKEDRKQGLWYFWLAAAILILVSGLRYGVGADYFSYARAFYGKSYDFSDRLLHFNEPGSVLLTMIGRCIAYDFTVMTILTALITIGLIFIVIQKYSEDYCFSALLFILTGSFHGSFNAIRQYLALAILFAGYRFIVEQKLLCYLGIIVLAMCFHRTALIMLPCYFILNIKEFRQFLVWVIIFSLFMFISHDRFLTIMSDLKGTVQMTQGYSQRSVNLLRVMVAFLPLILFYLTPVKVVKTARQYLYIKILILNAMMLLSTSASAYIARVAIYTDIYSVLALPAIYKLYPPSKYRSFRAMFIMFYGVFWLVEVTRRDTLLPFRWVFQR